MYQVTIDSRYADAITRYMNETLDGIGTFTYDPATSIITFDTEACEHFTELDDYCDCHIDDNGVMWVAGCDYDVTRTAECDVTTGTVAIIGDRNIDGSHRESYTVGPWGADETDMDRADGALEILGYIRCDNRDWQPTQLNGQILTVTVRARA